MAAKRAVLAMLFVLCVSAARAAWDFDPEFRAEAGDPAAIIDVGDYSVPSLADVTGDGLPDLIVGAKTSEMGKVRIYANTGIAGRPQFDSYFYAQSNGRDLECSASGCMGCFPRAVHWDDDDLPDLLVGLAGGGVRIYRNIGSASDPTFDGGRAVEYGPAEDRRPVNTGARQTPSMADWNGDGVDDLITGAMSGCVDIFINQAAEGEPNLAAPVRAALQAGGSIDIGYRSSPVFFDLDGDGLGDLIIGDTPGCVTWFRNVGSRAEPLFAPGEQMTSDGVTIDLSGSARSRPSVADWNADGRPDLLVGGEDGRVHVYLGKAACLRDPQWLQGDLDGDGAVNWSDFAYLVAGWDSAACGCCGGADVDGNGYVNIGDLLVIALQWMQSE